MTDLHQHFGSLEAALGRSLKSTMEALKDNPKMVLVFLGDYGDRGSFEVFMPLLELKLMFPNQVWLLRGNHEVRNCHYSPCSSTLHHCSLLCAVVSFIHAPANNVVL